MFQAVQAQEIWRESFLVSNKGIWGSDEGRIISDFSGITSWTLIYDETELNLENPGDYAKTVATSGGRFEVCDIDGEVVWVSELINISAFEKVDVQLTAAETGSGANVATKYLKAFYKIDGSEEIQFDENYENAGNWGSAQVVSKGLSGNSLQIICYISNHYASDKVILDEVVVSEEEKYFPLALAGELLLSEILFNPFPGGEDYVEIFNNSDREIPLGKLFLATRNKNLELTQINSLAGKKYLIQPKSYVAITKDTNAVFPFYPILCSDCFQQVAKMTPYNNTDDYVVLLNENLEILDELHYTEKMHTPFLANRKGFLWNEFPFLFRQAHRATGILQPKMPDTEHLDMKIRRWKKMRETSRKLFLNRNLFHPITTDIMMSSSFVTKCPNRALLPILPFLMLLAGLCSTLPKTKCSELPENSSGTGRTRPAADCPLEFML